MIAPNWKSLRLSSHVVAVAQVNEYIQNFAPPTLSQNRILNTTVLATREIKSPEREKRRNKQICASIQEKPACSSLCASVTSTQCASTSANSSYSYDSGIVHRIPTSIPT
jgi:hypothetical protein